MKHRFETESNRSGMKRFLFSLLLFVLVILFFFIAANRLNSGTDARAKSTLEQAVTADIARCYAMEGRYPEDIAYLEEHYGLTYDEDRFTIDYRVDGSNIMPRVTIIDTKE